MAGLAERGIGAGEERRGEEEGGWGEEEGGGREGGGVLHWVGAVDHGLSRSCGCPVRHDLATPTAPAPDHEQWAAGAKGRVAERGPAGSVGWAGGGRGPALLLEREKIMERQVHFQSSD